MRKFIAICVPALAAATAAVPAAAGPSMATVDPHAATLFRQLDIRDLDVGSAAGARALRYRVSNAVNELCDEAVGADNGSADYKFGIMHCRKSAMREARAQVTRLLAKSIQPSDNRKVLATALLITVQANR